MLMDKDKYIELLESRIVEANEHRNLYDARRRDAMGKIEEWRSKCFELEAKLKKFTEQEEV